jgi:peptidoglycan/LPS O-acetylase OafA/YrhL
MHSAINPINGLATDESARRQDTPKSRASGKPHIKSLTGLRIFPAVVVVFFHAGEHFSCLSNALSSFAVSQIMTFFFVLSGFILTLNYPRLPDLRTTASFYVARIARVWPAHAASLLLLIFLIPETFRVTSATLPMLLSNISLTHAWIPSWKYFFSFNAPSWSNSTDMFFYLCFPLLLLGLSKWRWYWVTTITSALTLAFAIFCNWQQLPEFHATALSNQALMYIHPLARIFEFSIGMMSALLFNRVALRDRLNAPAATIIEVLVLVAVMSFNLASTNIRIAATPLLGAAGGYWLYNSGIPLFGMCALLMILATEKGLVSRVLGLPFLVILGEMSFALYMLHSVLLAYHGINFPIASSVTDLLMFLSVLFISSHLLWMLVEKPVRKGILSAGSVWLGLGKSNKKQPVVTNQSKILTKAILVAGEILALCLLTYFTVPGVHRLTQPAAAALAEKASVRGISFDRSLTLDSASAKLANGGVTVDLVWQAVQPGIVNFFISADVLDQSGQMLSHTTYMQDLRRTNANAGDIWIDSFRVSVPQDADARYLSIKVLKSKRKVLLPESQSVNNQPPHTPETLLVPISR